MKNGLYLDIPESRYHADDFGELPTLSVSTTKALVNESPAHAYLRHPKLGGTSLVPTTEMDRGTLCHALLLGKGPKIAVVECDDWKKETSREIRDSHRAEGKIAVTRKLYDASTRAAEVLERKLEARGYKLSGRSEVTILWTETATDGTSVRCRARMDHILEPNIFDLKIGSANPKRFKGGHLTEMGYDIQGAAYPRALESVVPVLSGRVVFRLLFCEPDPPYCITPVRFAGSLRELGLRKWQRGIDRFARSMRTGIWGDYTDSEVVAEARPWDIEEEAEETNP